MGGKRSFSKPPSRKANIEYGMAPKKKASFNTQSLEPSMGNKPTGFKQTTLRKSTAAGPAKKPPSTPGQFQAKSVGGNRDFGLIGASAPAPMTPDRVPRLMGELKGKKRKKGF